MELSFPETHQSLSLGVVDCAITGASSANSAGWPEVSTHQMPIAFQVALNAYAVTLKSWNQLKPDQQDCWPRLQAQLGKDLADAHEGLRFNVTLSEQGELPRFELKAKRLQDLRPQY